MKYVIIGAGGTGGIVGAKLAREGKDVSLIARGAHLEAMQQNGLTIEQLWNQQKITVPVKALSMDEYNDQPDVILVCVKGYSLDSIYPFIHKIAKKETIVIPILNIFGTGSQMQKELTELLVTDGCIYVSANIKKPGVLVQHGEICRIVFGVRDQKDARPELKEIEKDFNECGILGILSENIQRDALQKFSYVSPIGAAGLFYNCTAKAFQREGEEREMFKAMIREIIALANAMNIQFEQDLTAVNLKILSDLAPESTTSMQRDVIAGKSSEMDGLVFQVVRMGHQYNVPVPVYEKVAEKFGFI